MTPPTYGDGFVAADRRPENQLAAIVGPEGLVARLQYAPTDGPAFLGVMRETRQPVDPSIISMPPLWPLTPEGRGLSVIECEQQRQARAAA